MEKERLIETVIKARQGDSNALQDLYLDMYKPVYFLALRIVKNPEDAEDITQEVYITVQQKIAELREPVAFYGWVNQIAVNKCNRYFSKYKGLMQLDDEDEFMNFADDDPANLPDKALDDEATRKIILEVIDNLPDAQRACVILYYYTQNTISQIADMLETNENTVKSRLALARAKIRAALEEKADKEGIKLWGIPLALTPILRQDFETFTMPKNIEARILDFISKISTENISVSDGSGTGQSSGSDIDGSGDVGNTSGQVDPKSGADGNSSGNADISQNTAESVGVSDGPGTSQPGGSGSEVNTASVGQTAYNARADTEFYPLNEEGLNSNINRTNALNPTANAKGIKAKIGGLIKMFLGLSIGKKIAVIAGIVALVVALSIGIAACSGGGNAPGGGNATNPPATTPSATPSEDEHNCPCDPECTNKDCEGGDKCKCGTGSSGPFTFLVEIDTNFVGSLGQVYRTIGNATVTLDDFDESGWFGSADGHAEYTDWGPEYQELTGETDYSFFVRLSNYDPLKGDSITVGTDRFCQEDGFLMMSFEVHRMDLFDRVTGLYTFELPMNNGVAKLVDHWVEPPPGLIVIDMTITITLLDQ